MVFWHFAQFAELNQRVDVIRLLVDDFNYVVRIHALHGRQKLVLQRAIARAMLEYEPVNTFRFAWIRFGAIGRSRLDTHEYASLCNGRPSLFRCHEPCCLQRPRSAHIATIVPVNGRRFNNQLMYSQLHYRRRIKRNSVVTHCFVWTTLLPNIRFISNDGFKFLCCTASNAFVDIKLILAAADWCSAVKPSLPLSRLSISLNVRVISSIYRPPIVEMGKIEVIVSITTNSLKVFWFKVKIIYICIIFAAAMIGTVFTRAAALLALFSLLLRFIAVRSCCWVMLGLVIILFEFALGQWLLKL